MTDYLDKPLKLAVIFDQDMALGGGFQQAVNAILVTKELSENLVEVHYFAIYKENIQKLALIGVKSTHVKFSFSFKIAKKIKRILKLANFHDRVVKILNFKDPLESILLKKDIDLVYFLSPTNWASDLDKLNYITTLWDLSHRDDPEFPEVRYGRSFIDRERDLSLVLPKATAILVDSELGKKNAIHRYGIDESRTYVMPFSVTSQVKTINEGCQSIDIFQKYSLDCSYVYYPAQFWAHKNHIYLLKGLKLLEDKYGLRVGAIFSGTDMGNLKYIKDKCSQFGMHDRVRFINFAPPEEIPALYIQSIALVMPSYFGPTNLPPLEAFKLRVPVLYSDKEGLRDQVGDAALLMDLANPETMAEHLKNLINNKQLRKKLIQNGEKKLKQISQYDRVAVLHGILQKFKIRRACWK
jgi:glycosyltransferase involved in cell wall biosynthesis